MKAFMVLGSTFLWGWGIGKMTGDTGIGLMIAWWWFVIATIGAIGSGGKD